MNSFAKSILLTLILILSIYKINGQKIIKLEKINGVFNIPCKVNGILMNFIFDTGATGVSISLTEAMFLMKQGLLNDADIKEEIRYKLANGKVENGTKIILKRIEIEGLVLVDIEASIVHNLNAPLLLGLSAISKLGKVVLEDDKIKIYPQNSSLTESSDRELIDSEFNSDIQKAFTLLFQTFKTKNYKLFIEKYRYLFTIPEILQDEESLLTSQFKIDSSDKGNNFQLVEKMIKESYNDLFVFGTKHSLNWNSIASDEIKIKVDNSNVIITFKYINDYYVLKSRYYLSNSSNRTLIDFPTSFETVRAYQYNKAIKEIFDRYDKKEISQNEYRDKLVEYTEWQYKYLSKNDVQYIDEYDRIDGIYHLRAQVRYQSNDFLNAMKDFNKVINLQSQRFLSDATYFRGRCKHLLEDYAGAVLDYNKYVELDPKLNNGTVFLFRADAKYNLKKYSDALIDYNRATKADPTDFRPFFNRGLLKFYEFGDKKGGCMDWSKAGELGYEEAYKLIAENCN